MEPEPYQKLISAAKYVKEKTFNLLHHLFVLSKPHLEQGMQRAQPYILKSKDFYQKNKEVILILGVATITYLIVRPRSKDEQKSKKKKQVAQKVPNAHTKTFMSDNSLDDFKEEPSTTNKVDSSGRQISKKKNNQKKLLERIQSSSQSQSGDKLFFAMYHNYQNA